MKFLCSSCDRLGEVQRFRVDGQALVLVCSTCGAESRSGTLATVAELRPAPATAAAAPTPTTNHEPFSPPAGFCPRCISKRSAEAASCASCGLTFGAVTETTFAPSDWLAEKWSGLLPSWADEAQHDALRLQAMEQGELASLGRLYRVRLAYAPSDGLAQRGRDEVLRLALLPHTMAPARQTPEVPTWKYVAAGLTIVASLVAILFLLRTMLNSPV